MRHHLVGRLKRICFANCEAPQCHHCNHRAQLRSVGGFYELVLWRGKTWRPENGLVIRGGKLWREKRPWKWALSDIIDKRKEESSERRWQEDSTEARWVLKSGRGDSWESEDGKWWEKLQRGWGRPRGPVFEMWIGVGWKPVHSGLRACYW